MRLPVLFVACTLAVQLAISFSSSSAMAAVYQKPTDEAVRSALLGSRSQKTTKDSSRDAEKSALGQFSGYEIRVIYPKFVQKRERLELGGQGTLIMNQTFIYTLMLTGLLDYHFSEMFALEVGGSFGFSIDKEDKRILDDEFEIKTQILRTKYIINGGLLWTPIYGKSQLPSGRLVYFDSFIHAGLGLTAIEYLYEQCIVPGDPELADKVPPQPAASTSNYVTFVLGAGQKYFLDRKMSIRWDVRDHFFQYNTADGSCTPEVSGESKLHQNVTFSLGASTLF